MRRLVVTLVIVTVSALMASNAYAAWNLAASGSGRSSSLSVSVPTGTSATPTITDTIHIVWNAPAGPSATPAQYIVRRKTPSTATVCTVIGTVFACDDNGLSASTTYSYTVEARIGSTWTSGEGTPFSATTNGTANVILAAAPGTQTAGTAFNVVLTATTNGVTDTTYTGNHAITFSGPSNSPSGATPTYPVTVNFAAGVGTANITLVTAQTVSLQATDGIRSGATSVTVAAAAASKLGYTSSSLVCTSGSVVVGNGGSFASFVSLFDTYGNPATAGALTTVTLSKVPLGTGTLTPTTLTVAIAASQTGSSFAFTLPVGNPPDVTVTASSGVLTPTQCLVRKN